MQVLVAIEFVLMLALALTLELSIGKVEREVKRMPVRYDDTD